MSDRPLVALQSLPVWLPPTSPWLHRQIHALPADIVQTVVVAERRSRPATYAHPRIVTLDAAPHARQIWDKGLRKLGLRDHLGIVKAVAKECGADVLHSHWGDQGWRDRAVARRLGMPQVIQFYGKEVGFLPRQQPEWLDRYADVLSSVSMVLCEGPHMAAEVVALGAPADRVAVQPLGVDVGDIPFKPRSYGRGDVLRVLIASSFREKKGIPDALDALKLVRDNGVDLAITIIGDASEDPRSQIEKSRILHALERNQLADVTRLLGYQSHARLMQEAFAHELFLAPSKTAEDGDTEGGAPVVLQDIAATGMPIVSTFHCDIPNIVRDGDTGWLAPEGDVDALADRIVWLTEHPQDWGPHLQRARDVMEAEFDAAVLGRRLAYRYAGLVKGRPVDVADPLDRQQ